MNILRMLFFKEFFRIISKLTSNVEQIKRRKVANIWWRHLQYYGKYGPKCDIKFHMLRKNKVNDTKCTTNVYHMWKFEILHNMDDLDLLSQGHQFTKRYKIH